MVDIGIEIEPIERQALEFLDLELRELRRWRRQTHRHACAARRRYIALEHLAQRIERVDLRLGERAEIQLERLRLDDVRRLGRHVERRDRDLWLAARIQPRELIRVPDIGAEERQLRTDADRLARLVARNRKEQRRVVLLGVRGGFAERGLFGCHDAFTMPLTTWPVAVTTRADSQWRI